MRILGIDKFEDFDGFYPTDIRDCITIGLDNDESLTCSMDHGILLEDDTWLLAKEITPSDILKGDVQVTNIRHIGERQTYSAENVSGGYAYYTNSVISHNCAFIEGYDEFFASVYPTISSGESTKLLMTSTPNGLNHFHKTCEGAEAGTNGYKFVKVMWYDVPGRDEKWKQETLEALDHDVEKFNVEYCCQFLGSSGTLISGEVLKSMVNKQPIAYTATIRQYIPPIENHTYVMIVDVSRGKGLDYSTFSIFDVTKMPYMQVCTFRDNMITPSDYASIIYRFGKMYNEAHTMIEINDIGGQVSDSLFMDFGYENMLFTESAGRSGKRISGGFGKNVDRGIRTTKSVKAIGCAILKLLVEQQQLVVNDAITIDEMKSFSKRGGSYEAESGKHDDMVMTLVLFAWLSDQNYFRDITDINTMMALRNLTEDQVEESVLPFGFIISNNDDYQDAVSDPSGDVWMRM